MTKKSDDVFCESWLQARQSFISRIQKLGGTYESIEISSKGPDQGELSIGVGTISLGSHALNTSGDLLLHISGVHGVEGFAGSAAQLQILDELLKQKNDGLFSDLPARTIVFIHTVNAFGMSWLRRNNSNNVDLNRNAIMPGHGMPSSRAYAEIHGILMDRTFTRIAWLLRLLRLLLKRGKNYVMQGLSGGQYESPDGFFYGGSVWQDELLLLKKYLSSRFSAVEKVFAIDIHTGLGPYGYEALFAHDTANASDVAAFARNLDINVTLDQIAGETTYRASGGFAQMIYSAFPQAKVRYLLQEFGTFNGFGVLRGLRSEHHVWLAGKFGPDIKASKNLKRLFFPEDSAWRRKVLEDSSRLFQKVVFLGFS